MTPANIIGIISATYLVGLPIFFNLFKSYRGREFLTLIWPLALIGFILLVIFLFVGAAVSVPLLMGLEWMLKKKAKVVKMRDQKKDYTGNEPGTS